MFGNNKTKTIEEDLIVVSSSGVRFNVTHYSRVLAERCQRNMDIPNSVREFSEYKEKMK